MSFWSAFTKPPVVLGGITSIASLASVAFPAQQLLFNSLATLVAGAALHAINPGTQPAAPVFVTPVNPVPEVPATQVVNVVNPPMVPTEALQVPPAPEKSPLDVHIEQAQLAAAAMNNVLKVFEDLKKAQEEEAKFKANAG